MKNETQNTDVFQNIFEAAVEGIIIVNEDGLILMANPACDQLFGYDIGRLKGKNIEILIPEQLKPRYQSYIQQRTTPPQRETNLWGIKKNNSRVSLNLGLSPTVIDGKNATIGFFWDATQQKNDLKIIKKTNVKLLESNRKFDALINNQKGIVYRSKNNRNYDMEYISEGCLKITGHPFGAFKKHKVALGQLIVEEDQNYVWECIQNAIRQKKQYDLEYRITHKDDSIKYVWEKGEAVYNDHDDVVALEGFISDITAQKEIELQLRASEAKMKALLEAIPDMMFIQDLEGVYLDWYANNPDKLAMPPKKFMGVNMKEVLPPDVYQILKTTNYKTIESGKIQIAEYTFQRPFGMEHLEARVVPMSDDKILTIIRDLTDEKTTDAQLNIKNNALASAINSIVISDAQQPHTPIIYCNAAFEKMTGYPLNELMGKNVQFLQNDDRDQKEIGLIKNAIKNGEACEVRIRNYRKDGSMFWNDMAITPVHSEESILTHFIAVHNDVTNKVKEENLKDQSRKILELIVKDSSLKTIGKKIVQTLEAHFKDCMASILLLDTKHNTLHNFVAPNLPKSFSKSIEGAVIGPNLGSCGTAAFLRKEIIVTHIPTSILWERYRETAKINGIEAGWSFPIMSPTKQVLGTIAIYSNYPRKPLPEEKEIILDMTHLMSIAIENYNNTFIIEENKKELEKYTQHLEEKVQERTEEVMATIQKLVETNLNLEDQILSTKQAERDAVKSKSMASEIAKNFPNGFVVVVNKDLTVQFAEGEALEHLGLKQDIFPGSTVNDISTISEERKAGISQNFKKTLSGQYLSFEVNYKDRYFAVNTAPLFDEHHEIDNALHVYSDISTQKAIEFTIQNSLIKERELNELKSRFVSMASHEFRTPLSAILTSAILIGKQNEAGQELKRERYLAQIERNVSNLTVILNDFLSLGKLEEGKITAVSERFDLVAFSKKMIKEIHPTLKKGQHIILNHTNEELFVRLDKKLLSHVLKNLLSNASKYGSEASNIDFTVSQKEDHVLIEITDQGIGIPKEEQKYLFGRFFRAKNAVNIEGTGLGLNIVKNYTELMQGTIEFSSVINKGSTFKIKFPNK